MSHKCFLGVVWCGEPTKTGTHSFLLLPPLTLRSVGLLLFLLLLLPSQDDSAAATPRSKSRMPRVSLQGRLLEALDRAELPQPQKRAASSKPGKGVANAQQQQQGTTQEAAAAAAAAAGSVGCFPSIKCLSLIHI